MSHLAVNGITLKNKEAIVSSLASTEGQPFSQTAVAEDRDYILIQYQRSGYPDATFDRFGE